MPNSHSFDTMPLQCAQQIDRLCDAFENQWHPGQRQRIQDYLEQIAPEWTHLLLRELVAIDVELRHVSGESVRAADYLQQFPEASTVVYAALAAVSSTLSTKHLKDERSAPKRSADGHAANAAKAVVVSGPTDDGTLRTSIGRYRVRSLLGQGAFGTVYLGYDPQLKRQVALKVPRQEWIASGGAQSVFLHEARAAAQVKHPGLATVYDVQWTDTELFIVQEYIAGYDLEDWAQLRQPSFRDVAQMFVEIAEAIGFAHRHGLVHRDLKPANILVDEAGHPHVTDFGLAVHENVQRRRAGEIAGTPAYMSPEQVRGETHRLDGRSDLWSLGVILYEILAQGRRPFEAGDRETLFELIQNQTAKPPGTQDNPVPEELERICLRCLEKPARARYQTASELAEDVQAWLDTQLSVLFPDATADTATNSNSPVRVVPKGLRSFDSSDADFFLELLPGPHDREGLPESVRFWKTRIEKTDDEQTFALGVLYGPSGCGKSSLVKAGLIPRLAPHVLPLTVEATPAETETRVLRALHKHCPELPTDAKLPELLSELRENGGSVGRKVLLILDQFEQWLHAHDPAEDHLLIRALRQCDGGHMQCLILVRDDFWMSVTEFMQALEIPLVEGHNLAPANLFYPDHAQRVLEIFGRAYRKLPESPEDLTSDQQAFLTAAVDGLTRDGKVISVRLALFADMMQGRPWLPGSLQQVGGALGVGSTFLEETFSSRTAPPTHRRHEEAARAVLEKLLPTSGSDIRGQMRSRDALLEASGYADRPEDFADLLEILDKEVRLITPTEPNETGNGHDTSQTSPHYYQLTHDYLVPSLREWLTRKQKETQRGRAELLLAERSATWNAKPENRYLPAWWEYARIRRFTSRQHWTAAQRTMMTRARRVHATRWGTALLLTLLVGLFLQHARQDHLSEQVSTLVSSLRTTRGIILPPLDELKDFPSRLVLSELHRQFDDLEDARKLTVAYALAHYGDVRVDYLVSQVNSVSPDEVDNLVTALRRSDPEEAVAALLTAAAEAERREEWRHEARLAMLALKLETPTLAREMCRLQTDPNQRTQFIEECAYWHGDLLQLAELIADERDGPLQSALLLAMGRAPHTHLLPQDQGVWRQQLTGLFHTAQHAATRSAAGWALRQWKLPVPEATTKATTDTTWHVNSIGMMMVPIPAGQFQRRTDPLPDADWQTVTLSRPFFMSATEVTRAQFEQFIDDQAIYHDVYKPDLWRWYRHELNDLRADHPVGIVSFIDALHFCNWLSLKEGLQPCYVCAPPSAGKEIVERLVPNANGYRLPTEAEWEYACRAGATTLFCFGDDQQLIEHYAVCGVREPQPPGSRMPNGWGLFDMHGNVEEWCYDWYSRRLGDAAVTDPLRLDAGQSTDFDYGRVTRGGSYKDLALNLLDRKHVHPIDGVNRFLGFRVVRTDAAPDAHSAATQ